MALPSLQSDIGYAKVLLSAGWNGARSAHQEVRFPVPKVSVPSFWAPIAAGALIGILSATLDRRRRSASSVAFSGLLGSAVGLTGGMAWSSRGFTGAIARGAVHNMNEARDAHWLAKHPIAYA
jgi:hypothetical protein